MLIFSIGDVVGEAGIRALENLLPAFKKMKGIDFTIVNGENADGMGILPASADRIFLAGADVITLGNHSFSRHEMLDHIDHDRYILRPANLSCFNPGNGCGVYETNSGMRIAVISLMGRIYMDSNLDNPFFAADRILTDLDADIVAVDIHAEATSEKAALARYLDGRVSLVFGTHTHVQTSDERILPLGTGFITDIGMTGPVESILGMEIQSSIDRLLGVPRVRYKAAAGKAEVQGAIFEIDSSTRRCISVERITIS